MLLRFQTVFWRFRMTILEYFMYSFMRLCKTAHQCESHSVELFLLNDLKTNLPYVQYVDKPRHTAFRILKKFPKNQKQPNLAFFLFGFINFHSQENEFSTMFSMFVNVCWIHERFGFMRVSFKHWPFNIFCLIFSLD